jgi:hypothetical protein
MIMLLIFADRHHINEDFVRHGGYNEVGELNDIIILYPQVTPTLMNLNSCWDGYGYTGSLFGEFLQRRSKNLKKRGPTMCTMY